MAIAIQLLPSDFGKYFSPFLITAVVVVFIYVYFYYRKLYFLSLWILMSEIKFWLDLTYSKMHLVWCLNTHHDLIHLVNHGMIKNTKTWMSWEQKITFRWNKNIFKTVPRMTQFEKLSFCSGGSVPLKCN